ncbi:hypothetical protein QF022_002373 [Vogesella perlucida]|nr:hypothetical protein [Vogesella perlucida]
MRLSVDSLFTQAFSQPRDPRSESYKLGVRAALQYRIKGTRIVNPYPPASAQCDAFYAGTQEGHAIWRRAKETHDE